MSVGIELLALLFLEFIRDGGDVSWHVVWVALTTNIDQRLRPRQGIYWVSWVRYPDGLIRFRSGISLWLALFDALTM
jgi:hypothetical protein